jgi:hypothetical protein
MIREAIEETVKKFPRKHAYRSVIYARVEVDGEDVGQDVGGTAAMIRFFVTKLIEKGARRASATAIKTGHTFSLERLPSGMITKSGFLE